MDEKKFLDGRGNILCVCVCVFEVFRGSTVISIRKGQNKAKRPRRNGWWDGEVKVAFMHRPAQQWQQISIPRRDRFSWGCGMKQIAKDLVDAYPNSFKLHTQLPYINQLFQIHTLPKRGNGKSSEQAVLNSQ